MRIENRKFFKKTFLVTVYLFLIFCTAEAIFRHIPISHGIGYTLGAQLWFRKYWKPINQFGFRDYEIDVSIANKKKIFVLGDSFVAGHGIKFVKNRFSDIVSEELPNQFQIINMGKNGLDTLQEIQLLNSFPYKPDILILVYSPNDIADRAAINGLVFKRFTPYDDLNSLVRFIVCKSYFLNFLYWQFPHKDTGNSLDLLKAAYENKAILDAHFNDLEYFVTYSKKHSIPLYVIIFPYFTSLGNQGHINLIADFFSSLHIEVISVQALTANIPLNKLIVNKRDLHANELVNRIVADELLKKLKKNVPLL